MMSSRSYRIVFAGGGIMGCSSAFFLTRHVPPSQLCIVERDPTYKSASTVLSVGSLRQQFSLAGNILLSLRSAGFLMKDLKTELAIDGAEPPDIQFTRGSYLFLSTQKGKETLQQNHQMQRILIIDIVLWPGKAVMTLNSIHETKNSLGGNVKLMDSSELSRRYPWLHTDDLSLGSLGLENEGWFDPWLLLSCFKRKLVSLGVQFVHGEVVRLNVEQDKVKHVQILSSDSKDELEISCDYFVNSSGPHAARVAEMAGIGSPTHPNPLMRVALPVSPRKRQVFVFHCPRGPTDPVLLVDPSGVYFRRESQEGVFICGKSPAPHNDVEASDLEVDYSQFEEIWPILAARVPEFESLKVKGAWAGFYDYNTFDQNGILGPHPLISNFIFVNGFSGHGIQQSPEAGRNISDYIVHGKPSLAELDNFGFSRIVHGRKLLECNIV